MGMNMVPLLMGMLVAVLPLLVVVVLRDALLHRTCAARTHTRIAPCAHGHEHGTLAHGYARSRLALACGCCLAGCPITPHMRRAHTHGTGAWRGNHCNN